MHRFFSAIALFFVMTSAAMSLPVDLTREDVFIREGFQKEWISSIPADKAWIKIPGVESGYRQIRINKIKEFNPPRAAFLSFKTYRARDYTFITSFQLKGEDLKSTKPLGLYIGHLAQAWRIYVNGTLVDDKLFRNDDGSLALDKTARNVLVYLNPCLLNSGTNIIAFHIVGNPDSKLTGFYRTSPYIVADYNDLMFKRFDIINLILISIYLVIGIFHLLLFINRVSEKYNLFFGLGCIFLFLYLFNRTSFVVDMFDNSEIYMRAEYICLFLLFPLIGIFFDIILTQKISRFLKIFSLYSAILAVLSFFVPLTTTHDLLLIWQMSIIVPLVYIIVKLIYYYRVSVNIYKDKNNSTVKSFFLTLVYQPAGNLIIGAIVVSVSTIIDILFVAYFSRGVITSRYAFFLFIIGITTMLTNRFLFIHKKIESLNIDLQDNIENLNKANTLISISEEKYRSLVEGSTDAIFSLNNNADFVTANNAAEKLMGVSRENIQRYNLLEIVYDDTERRVNQDLVTEQLKILTSESKPVNFKVLLKTDRMIEPREVQLRLEYISIDDRNEILGKASDIMEDVLISYFKSESQLFEIGNFLITADEISHRITRNLRKYLNASDVSMLRLALREIIINAIEHGNLNISFEEKTKALDDDTYINIVSMRQKDPRFSGKKVSIEYSIDEKEARYTITDEGDGFNSAKYLFQDEEEFNKSMQFHGRGIMITRNVFDNISYNEKGNSVELVKILKG